MTPESDEPKLARLPVSLASLVDHEIKSFVEAASGRQRLEAVYQFQNVHLWSIYQDKSVKIEAGKPAILQTRVEIGAYDGRDSSTPDLVLIPDRWLMTVSSGRRIVPPEIRRRGRIVLPLGGYPQDIEPIRTAIRESIGRSWKRAVRISIKKITEPLP